MLVNDGITLVSYPLPTPTLFLGRSLESENASNRERVEGLAPDVLGRP
jgi:hypothetical protein